MRCECARFPQRQVARASAASATRPHPMALWPSSLIFDLGLQAVTVGIPEPGVIALLPLGALLLWTRRRSKTLGRGIPGNLTNS